MRCDNIKTWAIIGAGLGVIILLLAGCCDKKGPEPVQPKDYYVYFGDAEASPNTYLRYNTGTCQLDSFDLPYNSWECGFGISPDGKKMYLHPDGFIAEVSLESLVVVAEHAISIKEAHYNVVPREVLVSPDNRHLAIVSGYVHILDMADFSVVYADTQSVYKFGWFSDDGGMFLSSGRDSMDVTHVLELGLNGDYPVRKHYFDGGDPYRVIASADNRRWFMLSYLGAGVSRFRVYDMPSESLLFSISMCPSNGDLEITPGGHYVFYSQPGSLLIGCPPPKYITVFDVVANRIDRQIITFVDSLQLAGPIGELCITPDGRHLVGVAFTIGQLFHYQINRQKVLNRLSFQGGIARWPHSLACQRKL